MRQTLDRAEKFLNLVALLAALLAAVAVGIASRDSPAATLTTARCCGCWACRSEPSPCSTGSNLRSSACWPAPPAWRWASRVHYVFVWLLGGLVKAALPAASAWPALFGVGVGFTLLFGFGLPPVLQLARVPPLRVIRRDVGALKPASLGGARRRACSASRRCCWRPPDLKLGAIAVGGFAARGAVFALLRGWR